MTKHDDEAEDRDAAERALEGIAHLQSAAKELIAAGRAMLDAADELVDDPTVVGQLGDALGALVKLAGAALAGAAPGGGGTDGDDGPRVQRIRVS